MALFKGLTANFKEKSFYQKLTLIGRKLGIRVFVFSPLQVDFDAREVIGYEYRQGSWVKQLFPLPEVVYDRCFVGPAYRHYKPFVEKLQNDPAITFLGNGLFGKWQVYQILSRSPELSRWLPETYEYSLNTLLDILNRTGTVIAKPASGTHGIGIVRIAKAKGRYMLTGRTRNNQLFRKQYASLAGVKKFISGFTAGRKYLIQPYLSLRTPDGLPFDVRVLVQKNGEGKWQTTGKAVRVGNRQSITSNLHGGGRAVPLQPFLARYYPPEKQRHIEAEIDLIAERVPPFIESYHGRLAELGIDIGVDAAGRVWLIELNSRPGRNVFRLIEDQQARLHSLTQPVKYAHYLMKDRVGGY